jgi:hypothetical protein
MRSAGRQAAVGSRRCVRCPTTYPPHLVEFAFRTRRARRNTVCCMCEQAARQKRRNPYLVKAHSVIRRHAEGLKISKEDLVAVFGWDPQILAEDAEHQFGGRCNYCPEHYAGMRNGLADLTLDIVDRSRPPYYCTNTKWCCQTCNRNKGTMAPGAFEAKRLISDLWNRSKNEPPEQLTLFATG